MRIMEDIIWEIICYPPKLLSLRFLANMVQLFMLLWTNLNYTHPFCHQRNLFRGLFWGLCRADSHGAL